MRIIVDPPSGWKYGFPMELPEGKTMRDLLRESDYPEKDIEFALDNIRVWQEDDNG